MLSVMTSVNHGIIQLNMLLPYIQKWCPHIMWLLYLYSTIFSVVSTNTLITKGQRELSPKITKPITTNRNSGNNMLKRFCSYLDQMPLCWCPQLDKGNKILEADGKPACMSGQAAICNRHNKQMASMNPHLWLKQVLGSNNSLTTQVAR